MARNVTVRDMDAGWDKALRGMASLDGAGVEVGIFEEDGQHPNGNGLSIAEVAIRNEFGDDTTPARPFMATNYDVNQQRYGNQAEKVFGGVLRGRLTVNEGLQTLGAAQVTDVKATITNWTTPPNSPATIARKGENDPLVDTRTMRDSVKFKKKQRGGPA